MDSLPPKLEPTPRKKRRWIIVVIIVVALSALVGVWRVRAKSKDAVVSVQTDKVIRRSLTETVVANGRIQPVTQVKISPEVSGEIIDLPVKEGQQINKGDLILKINPDVYIAQTNQSRANYQSGLASKASAEANLEKAQAEYIRNGNLWTNNLISESDYVAAKTTYDMAKAQVDSATHQVEMAKASLDSALESLAKTTVYSPLTGTVTKLNSQLGERVVGTATMAGTEIMTISDLTVMEARVDVNEMDVNSISCGQKAQLTVDSFPDHKFVGTVSQTANSSTDSGQASSASSSASQEAIKFQIRIRVEDKAEFRPGMTVSAEIETKYRTNVLSVPIGCVTTRPPKAGGTNNVSTNAPASTNAAPMTNATAVAASPDKKTNAPPPVVVFVVEGDHVNTTPIKLGISDDNYYEITDGLKEGDEIVSGSYKAIKSLEDGKKILKGGAISETKK